MDRPRTPQPHLVTESPLLHLPCVHGVSWRSIRCSLRDHPSNRRLIMECVAAEDSRAALGLVPADRHARVVHLDVGQATRRLPFSSVAAALWPARRSRFGTGRHWERIADLGRLVHHSLGQAESNAWAPVR
jgi:hypothetical protein